MNQTEQERLEKKCRKIRYLTMDQIGTLGVGHAGGSMSIIDALVVVYYQHMNIDPKNPKMEGRDRFVLSKGHAGPALYSVLADKGYFPKEWLKTLNQPATCLPSHVNMNLTPGIDMTAGSLGQGISCAVGVALASRMKQDGARIYTVVGDGETDEGQVWEAAMFAGHRGLDNLTAFTDYNKMQLDGSTDEIVNLDPLGDKWRAFGWHVVEVDGHDVCAIDAAINEAKATQGKPTMIILHTLKGKGLSFLEANYRNNHNVTISPEQHQQALMELGEA